MDTRSTPTPQELKELTHVNTNGFFKLKKEKEEKPIEQAAKDALENAQLAAYAILPLITASGVSLMMEKNGGFINLSALGLPLVIGGFVLDTLKAPFCIAIATEEAIRAGMIKLVSLVFEHSPTQLEIDRIFKSFLIRMKDTATLLIALGLEDADVLNRKLQSGDIEDLVGLTLLHTAYASRHYPDGLLLANNKTLERQNCPTLGLPLFDKIMALKQSIRFALHIDYYFDYLSQEKKNECELKESAIVCQWIKLIKNGTFLNASDHPDKSQDHLDIVNQLIKQIDALKHAGMNILPEAPKSVVRHMPKR